jgi:hypothetical protein
MNLLPGQSVTVGGGLGRPNEVTMKTEKNPCISTEAFSTCARQSS